MMLQSQRGFSLIELMIALAILGVIAAIAIPSYNSMVIKSRRGDAKTALSEISQLQESYFADNNGYATTLSELQLAQRGYTMVNQKAQSKDGYYLIALENPSSRSFQLTATPQGNHATDDKECYAYVLFSSGKKDMIRGSGAGRQDRGAEYCW